VVLHYFLLAGADWGSAFTGRRIAVARLSDKQSEPSPAGRTGRTGNRPRPVAASIPAQHALTDLVC
jgi:hypothetical protein